MTSIQKASRSARLMPVAALSALLGCASASQSGSAGSPSQEPIDVVFVCQYGYAKSLVAAKHFERLAAERDLPVRVFARGMTPRDAVPNPIVTALAADGFDVAAYQPTALGETDLAGAEYLVIFSLEDTNTVIRTYGVARWDDVSALSENYSKTRDEIVAHLQQLLARIQRDAKGQMR